MRFKTVAKLLGIVYLIFSFYALFVILFSTDEHRREVKSADLQVATRVDQHHKFRGVRVERKSKFNTLVKSATSIEIWGKAAIGLYLWQHVFEAPLENINGEFLKYGRFEFDNLIFNFRTGPMVTPQSVRHDVKNAVLIINGREDSKINIAMNWLETLKKHQTLKNLAVVLLGNEQCNNEWLMPFMEVNGGFVKFAFIVYDIPYVDNKNFYGWPLGVATYRSFPVVRSSNLALKQKRKHICNFLGTVYENSSRTELLNIMDSHDLLQKNCFTYVRYKWLPSETKRTSELYQNAMKDSDLTLCPVGKNTECYRIYEAISYGSVPVIEDIMTDGVCGKSPSDETSMIPLRILKKMHAPVIYLKSWKELPGIIANEKKLSLEHKVKRRTQLVHWYERFRQELRKHFVKQIKIQFSIE